TVGKEEEIIATPTNIKDVAVVGGGLAGLSASITLKQRGHKVTLFEKNNLGGQFTLAPLPPHKSSLQKIINYLTEEIRENDIEVVKEEFTIDENTNYDEVVIATGSKAIVPPIEGLKEFHWAEILEKENLPKNKNILVVGGGLIGTEIANKLLSNGNKIFLVEMLGSIARGMEMIEQKLTLKALKHENVKIFLNTKVLKIQDKTIYLDGEKSKITLENIDIIVIATGMKSYNPFNENDFKNTVHLIGDAKKVGKAKDAIEDGFRVANTI
ncbi:MAG: FAD-dependent oxidoreductase, partial [Flavobacteriales bacterium]|nr:FAD-dependent oxidoreductase [Flavobacteriales bacterium]